MDVSRHILVVYTSILAKSNMDRREYYILSARENSRGLENGSRTELRVHACGHTKFWSSLSFKNHYKMNYWQVCVFCVVGGTRTLLAMKKIINQIYLQLYENKGTYNMEVKNILGQKINVELI
jgi:hypothetical protein